MPDSTPPAPIRALELPDIAYERVMQPVTILGTKYRLNFWVNGPGCPGRIKAEYARKVRGLTLSSDAPRAAHHEFLPDALRIVTEASADQWEALDLLGGEIDRAQKILIHYKWMEAPDAEESNEDPEAQGEDSTTDGSSPISLLPSAEQAPTAAAG